MKFGIFGGFGWVCSLILVEFLQDFGIQFRVLKCSKFGFSRFGLDLARFWLNRFKVWAIWRGSKGFEVQFWWTDLSSSEFGVRHVKFKAVQSSFYLSSIQH